MTDFPRPAVTEPSRTVVGSPPVATELPTSNASDPFGRDAAAPTEIPLPGWQEIGTRLLREFVNDRVLLVAGGTTFYLLLAMVPALSAGVSVYGLFTDPAGVSSHLRLVEDWMPAEGQQILAEQLARLAGQQTADLGFALVASLAIALWSSNAGMKGLFEAMNVAYGENEKRGFVKLTLVSLGFTAMAILLVLSLLLILIGLPIVIAWSGLSETLAGIALRIASGIGVAGVAILLLSALYRWGPSRHQARWRWISPGAVLAVLVGAIASIALSWYLAQFGRYNETYGSLGAVIGLMTWLWIMSILVITGAELNAELEHQTARDSTIGREAPLGQRGARMADTIARGPEDVSQAPSAAHAAAPAEEAARCDPDVNRWGRRTDLAPADNRRWIRPQRAARAVPIGNAGVLVAAIAMVSLAVDLWRGTRSDPQVNGAADKLDRSGRQTGRGRVAPVPLDS